MRVREWQSTGGQWVDREYTDDTILELFPDGDGSLVNPLLRRAQAAEAEIERLREELAVAEHQVESHAALLNEFAGHVQNAKRERDEARAAAKLIMDEELSDCPATRLGYELAFPWLKEDDDDEAERS